MILFSWSIGGICAMMLLLKMNLVEYFKFYSWNKYYIHFQFIFLLKGTINSVEMINLLLVMLLAFAIIFGVCDFGERFSAAFESLNSVYNQFAWHLFPLDVQRMLSILMIVAQKPTKLRAFGSISCGRITFQNVGEVEHACNQ